MVLAPGQGSSNVLHSRWMVNRTNPLNLICAALPTQLPFDKEIPLKRWRGQSHRSYIATCNLSKWSCRGHWIEQQHHHHHRKRQKEEKQRHNWIASRKGTSKVTLEELKIRFAESRDRTSFEFEYSYPCSIPLDRTSEFAGGTVACCVWQVIVELRPDSRAIQWNTRSVHFKMRFSLLLRMWVPVFIIVVNDQLN